MRTLLFLPVLFSFLSFTGGCTTDKAFRYYASEKYSPVEPDSVEVLDRKPTRPYDVIADFQIRGGSERYIRKQAAEVGADAVIISNFGGYYSKADKWANEDSYQDSKTRTLGTAIRWRR